jgi:ATP-dependent DNA helicase RecG
MRWWHFFRQKLDEGRQGFVIAPLVEEAETVEAANVQQTFDVLSRGELSGYRVGLLHGRMTPAEKDGAMQAFRAGRTQVAGAKVAATFGRLHAPRARTTDRAAQGRAHHAQC